MGLSSATRSAFNGSDWPIPRARTAAQETVVRRAVASANARAIGGTWIADSEQVLLLFEPGRYPVAYFPETDISSHVSNAPTIRSSTPISGPRPGMRSGPASTSHHEGRGSTPGCLPTRANCRDGSRSPGRPWTHSMKKTNGSRAMPLTATTASTFAKHPAASWSAIVTAPSPILRVRSSSTSSGFAPRWYVQRADIDESALTPVKLRPLPIQRAVQLLHHR